MTAAYVDTSVLIERAFVESRAAIMQGMLLQYDRLYSSALTEAEFAAAHRREKRQADFRLMDALTWVLPTRSLRMEIRAVTGAGHVRGADLWHIACALYLAPDARGMAFLTLDTRQAAIARELGFDVRTSG